MFTRIFLLLALFCVTLPSFSANIVWNDISSDSTKRLLTLDTQALAGQLNTINTNESLAARTAGSGAMDSNTIDLPLPDGGSVKLYAQEYSIMEPGADASGFRSWKVVGVENPAITGVIDLSSIGFHALLFMDNGETILISPDSIQDALQQRGKYRSFQKQDVHHTGVFHCGVHEDSQVAAVAAKNALASPASSPLDVAYRAARGLKTYRLAVAATGEFTQVYGGNQIAAFNAIQSMVTQINSIYERDLGVHLALINNPAIIFTNPTTDPYTSNVDTALLNSNTNVLNSTIGAGNYDLGHVVTKLPPGQIGGVAVPASVCGANKGAGATGSSAPNDPTFAIDFVAHEIGHQLGATHTFNSVSVSCGGGNRVAATAYEPGSGSSIMAYAGICGVNDLRNHSLPVFHIASIAQIDNVTRAAGDCGTTAQSVNQDPVITTAPGITVNAGQAFTLTATATDTDGDPVTFSWDQFDAGQASDKFIDTGDNAIFEVAMPSAGSRTFSPNYAVTNRTVNFQLVARDNKGGISTQPVAVTVINGSPAVTDHFPLSGSGSTGGNQGGGSQSPSSGGGGGSINIYSLFVLLLLTFISGSRQYGFIVLKRVTRHD